MVLKLIPQRNNQSVSNQILIIACFIAFAFLLMRRGPEAIRVLRKRGTFPPSAKIVRNSPLSIVKKGNFYKNACFSCPKSSKNAYFPKNCALRAHIIEKLQFLGPFRPPKRPIFDPFGHWGKFPRDPQFPPKSFPLPPLSKFHETPLARTYG